MLYNLIEMEIELSMFVENIIFLKLPYLVGIEDSMVLKNLLLTNHIAH